MPGTWTRNLMTCVQLESCLKQIFAKYCTPRPIRASEPPEGAYLSQEGLDAWARDTIGAPFDEATKEELLEFMDVTDDGGLTSVILVSMSRTSAEDVYTVSKGSCRSTNCKRRMMKRRLGEIS